MQRLEIRPPVEADRARFVELLTSEEFTLFSSCVHDGESANERFDGMLALAAAVPYGKQPIIERASGTIVGYTLKPHRPMSSSPTLRRLQAR